MIDDTSVLKTPKDVENVVNSLSQKDYDTLVSRLTALDEDVVEGLMGDFNVLRKNAAKDYETDSLVTTKLDTDDVEADFVETYGGKNGEKTDRLRKSISDDAADVGSSSGGSSSKGVGRAAGKTTAKAEKQTGVGAGGKGAEETGPPTLKDLENHTENAMRKFVNCIRGK